MNLFLISLLVFSPAFAFEDKCPTDWVEYSQAERCYYFGRNPRLSQQAASSFCQNNGATLLSVGGDLNLPSADEHNFIVQWLSQNDIIKEGWYTSGRRQSTSTSSFEWTATQQAVTDTYWNGNMHEDPANGDYLIYAHDGGGWGWTVSGSTKQMNYICEIPRNRAYLVDSNARDFAFGQNETDPSKIKRGPYFTQQPEDTIWDEESVSPTVTLHCVAKGNPQPTYMWYHVTNNGPIAIDFSLENTRFSMTGGTLTINQPDGASDNGNYQCSAENSMGKIYSNVVEFKVGFLKDFANTERNPVTAVAYEGTFIPCAPLPAHSPNQLLFSWYKSVPSNQIKPHLKRHIFNSYTGNLYFQAVTMDDDGNYFCIANSPAAKSGPAQGGKTSASNPLVVRPGTSQDVDPTIVDGFPTAFPRAPMLGGNLRLECVAYGTGTLQYKWSRPEKPLPSKSYTTDNGRVLNVPDLAVGEDGQYTCTVTEQRATLQAVKHTDVAMRYPPIFNPGLRNQHVDLGSSLLWDCAAHSKTPVTYSWYLNGRRLPDPENPNPRLTVDDRGRTLRMENLQLEDAGMYQCAASNSVGTRYTTAQIRVLAFKPTFGRNPVAEQTFAAEQGSVTLLCGAQAAPPPQKSWYKNGVPVSSSGRVTLLKNGNLAISSVQIGDRGTYECRAQNTYGTASSQGVLTVVSQVIYANPPRDATVPVNSPAVLECYATADSRLDLTYVWRFNGRKIDFNTEFYAYRLGFGQRVGSLHMVRTHFNMSGVYTCIAQTSVADGNQGVSATLKVQGPPGPPMGVIADLTLTTSSSVVLTFREPARNGYAIDKYKVLGKNRLMDDFEEMKANITPHGQVNVIGRQVARVYGLAPGSSYKFRIQAHNLLGWGEPSPNLDQFVNTKDAAPIIAPSEVKGGGGKVGTLTVNWEPLPPEHRGGAGMGYKVFQRAYRPGVVGGINWTPGEVMGATANKYTFLVGKSQSFKPYEVKVQAFNHKGSGPETNPPVRIMSAENLPQARPEGVWATPYNATAIRVYWRHIPIDQENINGILQGFRINYWLEDDDISVSRRATVFNPAATRGLIVGLHSDTYYWVAAMVYNDAGNGPPSEHFKQRTLKKPPQIGPLHVKAEFYKEGLRVQWQGISTTIEEEPLEGYKVRIWSLGQNIREAQDFDAGKEVSYVLRDVGIGIVYQLRVFGYSLGGEGRMSSPVISFRLGDRAYIEQSGERVVAGAAVWRVSCGLVLTLLLSAYFC